MRRTKKAYIALGNVLYPRGWACPLSFDRLTELNAVTAYLARMRIEIDEADFDWIIAHRFGGGAPYNWSEHANMPRPLSADMSPRAATKSATVSVTLVDAI